MPDKIHTPKGASFASDRLREVLLGMREMWKRSQDETVSNGCMDLYIVDADVVSMFMSPLNNHNYGALLRYVMSARKDKGSDLKELEARLVEFLGNLIFLQIRPTIPLIFMPAHAEDLERMLNNVWLKASRDFGKWEYVQAEIDKSAKNITEISKSQLGKADKEVTEKGENACSVKNLVDDVLRSLRGEGAIGELFRFGELMLGERLIHLDQIAFLKNGEKQYLPPPLDNSGKYIPSVSRLADRLYRSMISRVNLEVNSSRQFALKRDSQALAHLAWLNKLFSDEEWHLAINDVTSRKVRQAVLITGSNLLQCVIDELELDPLRRCVVSPLSFLGHQSMDEYFRRGTDYQFSRVNMLSDKGAQVSALINFFDSMHAVLNSAIMTKNSAEISNAVNEVRGKHFSLTENWQSRQLIGDNSQIESVSCAIAELEKSGINLDKLKIFLGNLSVDAWQCFARSVTRLSLKSVPSENAVLRNIPPVRFTHFDVAQQISRKLYSIGDTFKAREVSKTILDLTTITNLRQEDSTSYTEFVCYALFGLVNRILNSAEGCAELAWSIAKAEPKEGGLSKYIKGDEALYLLAHIVRLQAQRVGHLKRAEDYINRALILSCEIAENDNLSYANDIRYRSELFSIRCHRQYLESFGSVGTFDQHSKIRMNIRKLKAVYSKGEDLLNEMNKISYKREEQYLYEYVKQQILVNMVQISLIILYPAKRTELEKIEVHCILDKKPTCISSDKFNNYKDVSAQLIIHCEMLNNDKTGLLPKASILAKSVAATSNSVFRNKYDLDSWFCDGKVAAIDILRYKYLESVFDVSVKRNGSC